jgi:hypothetical protein
MLVVGTGVGLAPAGALADRFVLVLAALWSRVFVGAAGVLIDPVVGGIALRHGCAACRELKRCHGYGNILLANAQEAPDADHHSMNPAALVHEHVIDVTDVLVVGSHHAGANELGRTELILRPHLNKTHRAAWPAFIGAG